MAPYCWSHASKVADRVELSTFAGLGTSEGKFLTRCYDFSLWLGAHNSRLGWSCWTKSQGGGAACVELLVEYAVRTSAPELQVVER